jgi:hypothetical protein
MGRRRLTIICAEMRLDGSLLSPLRQSDVAFVDSVDRRSWSDETVQGAASVLAEVDNWEAGLMPALPPQR